MRLLIRYFSNFPLYSSRQAGHHWSFDRVFLKIYTRSLKHFRSKTYAESRFVTKKTIETDYLWYRKGDINAFFGLMLDNIAGLVLMVSLLANVFSFPVTFALRYMVPGTAIGVLVGDLLFFWQAMRYAKASGKSDVTAMPLGLDTPSTIGMALFVVGPAYQAALGSEADLGSGLETEAAAMQAWYIGICSLVVMGVVKFGLAFSSNWIHRVFPRAGLLGSLAAIALVLIAFNQFPKLVASPLVGFTSLVIVLVALIGRGKLPFKIPGALGAVLAGTAVWYLLVGIESSTGSKFLEHPQSLELAWFPTEWLAAFQFKWVGYFGHTLTYLGYIIPFAVATVIGGIDCAESAASVGDRFNTRDVIGTEAIATLVAGLCGGVIQTTPYIGHPAYKAMGGRAAYTLATALFVGGAGLIGYFSLLLLYIPEAALLPILVFIGLEITAQSFHATPRRHYAAIAVACLPALAKLVMIVLGQFMGAVDFSKVPPPVAEQLQALLNQLTVLSGGFILTSLIWASATAKIIDRRYYLAAIYFLAGGILTVFGFMHSPLPGEQIFWPWDVQSFSEPNRLAVINFAIMYLLTAGLLVGLAMYWGDELIPIETDKEFEVLNES